MKRVTSLYKICIVLSFGVLIACGRKEKEEQAPPTPTDETLVVLTDAQLKNAPVETTVLSMQHLSTIVKMNGKVDVPPQNMVSVTAPLGGYLKSTNLLPGMKVSKGQVVAVIENPQFIQLQQEYLAAKSKLHFAELDYNRQKELNRAQASSDKVMQQAQAEMSSQQIQLSALTQQLKLVNINPTEVSPSNIVKAAPLYSMIDGYVSKVNVNIGKYVSPTEILFEFINPDDIHLNLKVYEKDLEKLKKGQRLVAYTNINPDKKYNADVQLFTKDLDATGMADVHCHFEKYEPQLFPGTYMNAEIQTTTSFANALPEESVVDFEGKTYVFVQEKKQAYRLTHVTIGASEKGFVQVMNYHEFDGKSIVTKNAYTLLMKLKNVQGEDE